VHYAHGRAYCSLLTNEFSPKSLRAYRRRFGRNGASKYPQNHLFHLPQQAQTVESISGHTYIRKRISLTFFVKKLILWSEGLFQTLLSDATYFVYRAVTFFNEINLHPYSSYFLRSIIKLICRTSSIIDQLLGLIYTPVATSVATSVVTSVVTSVATRVTQICMGIYIIFNKINKATYVRSMAIYRLKIIARTSSIID
jgi:hypothetical protein